MTFNLKDLPPTSTEPYDIAAVHTDEFLLDQFDLYPGVVVRVLHQQAADFVRPPMDVGGLLARLTDAGVPRFASEARRHL